MVLFIIGFLVGGFFGFSICAIFSIAGNDDKSEFEYRKSTNEEDDVELK